MSKRSAAAAPQSLPAVPPLGIEFRAGEPASIPIDQIRESTTNPRGNLGDLDGLTLSIRTRGILVPLIVRPSHVDLPEVGTPRDRPYELVAGSRRLRAACAAGLTEVPAIVRVLTDDEAVDVQIIENAQREDIHPLEEAEAFQMLGDRLGGSDTWSTVAARVGKTRAHVLRRIQLLALPANARRAFLGGRIGVETALLIARIPNAMVREKAALAAIRVDRQNAEVQLGENDSEMVDFQAPIPHAAVKALIGQRFMLRLADAPFDRADATLVPSAGACGPCPKRTGNQRELFGDVQSDETCTDPPCFEEKVEAAWKKQADDAAAKGATVLTMEASRRVFPYPGNADLIGPGTGYVDPDSEFRDGMSIRQVLGHGSDFHVTVARDPNGRPRELWLEREVHAEVKKLDKVKQREAAATAVPEAIAAAARRPQSTTEKQKRAESNAREIEIATLDAALRIIPKKACEAGEMKFLRLLATCLPGTMPGEQKYANRVADHLGLSNWKTLVEDPASIEKLRAGLLLVLIGNPETEYGAKKKLEAVGALLKVDLDELRKKAKADLEAPKPAKKAKR
jgi:ParB/RepB/Spo0J family partition protein